MGKIALSHNSNEQVDTMIFFFSLITPSTDLRDTLVTPKLLHMCNMEKDNAKERKLRK